MSNMQPDLQSPWEGEYEEESSSRPLHEHFAAVLRQIAVLWRAKWLVAAGSLAGLVLFSAFSYTMRPRFTSTVTLMPPDTAPVSGLSMLISMKTGMITNALSSQFGDVLGVRSQGQLSMRQMTSTTVQEKLIRRFNLASVYKTKRMVDTIRALNASTKMDEDRKNGTLSVTVTDTDPKLAAALANAYPEELGNLLADLSAASGRQEREYFERELANARARLGESARKLAEFSATHGVVDANMQDAALVGSTNAIQMQIIATEAQIKSLTPVLGEDNVKMKALRARLAELQRQLNQVRGKVPEEGTVASAPTDGSAAGPSHMGRMAGLSVPYAELYRDVRVNEALVETLTQQYEIARLQESHRAVAVQVLEPAEVAEAKSAPKRRQFALAGLIAGFLFTSIFVFLRNWWRNAGPEDVWKNLLLHGPGPAPGGTAA